MQYIGCSVLSGRLLRGCTPSLGVTAPCWRPAWVLPTASIGERLLQQLLMPTLLCCAALVGVDPRSWAVKVLHQLLQLRLPCNSQTPIIPHVEVVFQHNTRSHAVHRNQLLRHKRADGSIKQHMCTLLFAESARVQSCHSCGFKVLVAVPVYLGYSPPSSSYFTPEQTCA
jgi:hypothetical protein